jgi:hypothetical protein
VTEETSSQSHETHAIVSTHHLVPRTNCRSIILSTIYGADKFETLEWELCHSQSVNNEIHLCKWWLGIQDSTLDIPAYASHLDANYRISYSTGKESVG